ncbi:MAG TPA: molybdopterin-dependent oxidoreductase [Fimbriimonadales bacterium]|nr:molybdopterin-dependent oxidoreductase [Fimbriimonadales bacterium]
MTEISRREFLTLAATVAGAGFGARFLFDHLKAIRPIENPLAYYPERGWEDVYREQYRYDNVFSFVCSPNCTHACRMKALTRNGVVLRLEPAYDVERYADQFGNTATAHWHPRGCAKGYTIHRRLYGPYRLKYPMVRKGWKEWAKDGFPYLTPELRKKYKFDSRGSDTFVRLTWDEAFDYIADGMIAIAKTYSGKEGEHRLAQEGYPPEMLEAMHGAGTRTFKLRGGMGLLGVIGKYGMYRFANMLGLLDSHVRGVGPKEALGGRKWSNYTWHGDQAPGLPFVHGLQSSEPDLNDLRLSKLHIQVGKNLVENKLAESHFFIELMERGGKIVVITPEYGPPATKSDYWIPVRPGATDTALFLGISKIIIDEKLYNEEFVKAFTDFPLLVRTDTLKRLRASEVFPNYKPGLKPDGPSFSIQGLKPEQYEQLGDFVVYDSKHGLRAITRDVVGEKMKEEGIDPDLDWKGKIKLVDGTEVEVQTLWSLYKIHLRDYDLDTVHEICKAPKELILRLARDIGNPENHPVAIHMGEGINHWFHATEANRAITLPLILTGNIGKPGAGCHTWAGNYKAAIFQAAPWCGPGFSVWVGEDPFEPNLNPNASAKEIKLRKCAKDEEPAYWNRGDRPLIVETPAKGRIVLTGHTHMPTPSKVLWFTNVNLFNNAKWAYDSLKNVNPNIDLIICQDIEMTSTCEYSDFILPANSWLEFQTLEITGSCSNPFLQIWKGDLPPLYDTKDDVAILCGVAQALGKKLNDRRFEDYWKFAIEGKTEVYINRLLDASTTTHGYTVEDIMAGKYGEPGAALLTYRTYPRIPFYEQIHDNIPFFTDTGRLNAYCDIPEAIACGENFIVHREGPEATPYLPNVIISSNPYVRPENYGITPEMLQSQVLDADLRTVANNKLPWSEAKKTKNPLWEQGYRFFCLTPKTRHRVHSQWSVTDWNLIWDSNFADIFRKDKRSPGVGEHQININPEAAKDLGLADGDYVYVDANPADRPYRGANPNDPFYKVARLMLRVKYNPAYPYDVVMIKHAPFIATEKSVKAHETRPDGRAQSEDTGYQANLRYGSQQSITRDWSMPMHQTDTLFHKSKIGTEFIFGGEADNHALNTVPKETLVKISKAEPGGLDGKGEWEFGRSGFTPRAENDFMQKYLSGKLVEVVGLDED